MLRKNRCIKLIIIASCAILFIGCSSQKKEKPSYTNELTEERYAPDFKLKKGLTYYSIIKENDENILLFWSAYCPHCEKVIDFIKTEKVYKKLKNVIFTVSIDETIDDIKIHEKDFPIYLDYNHKVFKSFDCEHIPTVYIIDAKGQILAFSEGGEASITLIKEYINHND